MPHATLMSSSFSCGCLVYRFSVAPLDLHIEVILIRIAQPCATFPLTLRRYDNCWQLVLNIVTSPFLVSHYLNDRDHAHARPRSLLIPTAYQLLFLHPTVLRCAIIKSADQQASIFLHHKLKVASPEERARIVDAICACGEEIIMHRCGSATGPFSAISKPPRALRNAVRALRAYAAASSDLATNCHGYYVLQKVLDCKEEEVCMLIVSELLRGVSATTLVNKHASHVWSKFTELSRTPPAPPIFRTVLAYHEPGSLVVQHAFENLEESSKEGIDDELPGQGAAIFSEIPILIIIDTVLEHGSKKYRQMALEHLFTGLLEGREGDARPRRAAHVRAGEGARLAMTMDLALSLTGSQLIVYVPPTAHLLSLDLLNFHLMIPAQADKDQCAALYDCIHGRTVTLRGSKVIWLLYVDPMQFLLYPLPCVFLSSDRMRAYYEL
ncbi:hypothetical protein C8J57DRAFT_1643832 [Mycena rebaudengoi]|nr:hypothetical protein C8J57DRAFT_1643832 [Mycena rebaudengoi]